MKEERVSLGRGGGEIRRRGRRLSIEREGKLVRERVKPV